MEDVNQANRGSDATAPTAPKPVHPPRVQIPMHPPRVQMPAKPIPLLAPPTVPTFQNFHAKSKPAPPRVPDSPKLLMPSQLQQRRSLRHTISQQPSLQHLQAIQTFQPQFNHTCNAQGKKETIDTFLSGKDGATWTTSLSNESGCLAQGHKGIVGTDTINFVH